MTLLLAALFVKTILFHVISITDHKYFKIESNNIVHTTRDESRVWPWEDEDRYWFSELLFSLKSVYHLRKQISNIKWGNQWAEHTEVWLKHWNWTSRSLTDLLTYWFYWFCSLGATFMLALCLPQAGKRNSKKQCSSSYVHTLGMNSV